MSNEYNIVVFQNQSLLLQLTYKDHNDVVINISGYTAKMEVRETADSEVAILTLTDADGLTLGGAAGTIVVEIPEDDLEDLVAKAYAYDLLLTTPTGVVVNLISGPFTIVPGVTKLP